jgi:peptidyl-Asp metalloendopeptidase
LFTEIGSDAIALTPDEIKVIQFYQEKPTTNSVKLVRVAPNYNDFEQLRFRPIGQELQRMATKSSVTIEDEDIKNSWVGNLEQTDGGGHLILFDTPFGTMGSLMYGDKTIEIIGLRDDISVYVESNNDINPQNDCANISESVSSTLLCDESSNCTAVVDVLAIIHIAAAYALDPNFSLIAPLGSSNHDYRDRIRYRIQKEIARTNLAFANSDIQNKKLRLVGVNYIDLPVSNSISIDLVSITKNKLAQQFRKNAKADIVVLITDQKYIPDLGVALQFPYYSVAQAFAVVEASTIGTSFFTFSHEVGHLLGANHDGLAGVGCAHAHRMGQPQNFTKGTILAGNVSRILHYSNPEVNYNGEPTGVINEEDNARKIKNSACLVSNFSESLTNINYSFIDGKETICCNCTNKYTAVMTAYPTVSNYTYVWEWSIDPNFGTFTKLTTSTTNEITVGNLAKPFFYLRVKSYNIAGDILATIVTNKIEVIQPCPEPPGSILTNVNIFPNPAAEELNLA